LLALRADLEEGHELTDTFERAADWRETLLKVVAPSKSASSDS
jgi:hypothetical protein